MKILLAYAGKNGTTAACVERLQGLLQGREVVVANLEKETPQVSDFDIVALGSSVYFGRLRPAARRFLQEQEEALQRVSLALFLCCGLTVENDYYREKLFPASLREHAFINLYFGGSLRLEGLSFLDRLVVHNMRSRLFAEDMENGDYVPTLPSILPENIDQMVSHIKTEITRLCDR